MRVRREQRVGEVLLRHGLSLRVNECLIRRYSEGAAGSGVEAADDGDCGFRCGSGPATEIAGPPRLSRQ
ncbi:hypothetical protein Acsp02_53550 [Actinoplanes sp. NBRC 103695]|nr:hypothetical protein Acsp02_53550 [Actinoplanes sp. NBRC 103695]